VGLPHSQTRGGLPTILTGVGLTFAGELVRVWGVRHIGVISRTRSDRLGPLISRGPFGYVRNPLYLGNVGLWVGFALAAREVWLALLIVAILGVAYHAIVRWEETVLEQRIGQPYRDYVRRVPRWLPTIATRPARVASVQSPARFTWQETLYSERGTLLAIAAGYALLWLKATLAF
jgi:protein-S-isoprenylcysteine O-methyltransferase Ste14